MPRSSSSHHTKGKSEGAASASHGAGFGGAFAGWRSGSRRNSKVPSEDGHAAMSTSGSGGQLHHSPSVRRGAAAAAAAAGDDSSRSAAALDRHARMRMAMSEAQNDSMPSGQARSRGGGASEDDAEDDEGDDDERNHNYRHAPQHGSESPRTKLAAGQARAHAAAAVAAAQQATQGGMVRRNSVGPAANPASDNTRTALNGAKPGDGSLTFDLLGGSGGDVVLADGVPFSASGLQANFGPDAIATPTQPPRPSMGPRSASASSIPRSDSQEQQQPLNLAAREPQRAGSALTVPDGTARIDDRGRKKSAQHSMHGSASTSALSPGGGAFGRLRKLSDASSAGGGAGGESTARSREHSPVKSRKKGAAAAGAGGIAAALAASGAGVAGYGLQDPRSYSRPQSEHGQQAVDKDYVGGSQGGVYRDPHSGELVEKTEDGKETRYHPGLGSRTASKVSIPRNRGASTALAVPGPGGVSASRRSSVSGHSASGSESSDASGLGAAASFPAMQAGALLTPAHGAPTIALDSAHAEHVAGQAGADGAAAGAEGKSTGGDQTALSAPGSPRPNETSAASSATVTAPAAGSGWPVDMGAQITGFAVASSKRNADFHALFSTVPEDDYLIEDYGCAMVREILIQGRIYISENYICFNANIFGWVTNIVLAFSEIVSIEKRMTARIIPNAIQISTLHVKHTFSSFLSRDTTYDLMANIWKLSHPDVPSAVDAAGDASDDESEAATTAANDDAVDPKLGKRARFKKKLVGTPKNKDASAATANGSASKSADAALGSAAASSVPTAANGTHKAAKTKKAKHPKTSCPCDAEKKHMSTIPLDTTYPCTPEKLFSLLFKDDFMKDFWTGNQKLFDLHLGGWEGTKREFDYIKPLGGSIGPKQTKCMITDEEIHTDFDDYVTVMTTTRTPDVPAGNSFSVKTRTCLTWNGNGNVVRMFVSCATEWTGRSMLRSVIDKASIDGQKQYYTDLDKAIRAHMKEHPDKFREEGEDDDVEADEKEALAATGEAAAGEKGAGAGGDAKEGAAGAGAASDAAASAAAKSDGGLLAQTMDIAQTVGSTLGDVIGGLSELSPSMLILGGVVALLVFSNIWALSSSGAGRGHQRDPTDPHRLIRPSGSSSTTKSSAQAVEIAHAVRDVLRDYLEPLASGGQNALHGRHHRHHYSGSLQDEVAHVRQLMDEVEERMSRLRDDWDHLSRRAAREGGGSIDGQAAARSAGDGGGGGDAAGQGTPASAAGGRPKRVQT